MQTSRRRDAIYVYLTKVFGLVRKYRIRGQLNELICRAQQKLRVTKTDGSGAVRCDNSRDHQPKY